MRAVFIIAIFLAAGLLFLVQPMSAKMLLPLVGGSPQVWNTCMVFFQGALLLGYLYSHVLTTRVPLKAQFAVHVAVMAVAAAALPMIRPTPDAVPGDWRLSAWLLGVLVVLVGGPFFAVSTLGPLLQRWFSRTSDPRAGDPYFLYAASNAGSAVGLLAYPVLLEPWFTLGEQAFAWTALYALLILAVIACVWAALKHPASGPPAPKAPRPEAPAPSGAVPWRRRAWWVLLAFVPSTLLLGATQAITTDVAPVPMLWVLPLFLYLLSMTLAFSPGVRVSAARLGSVAAPLGLALAAYTLAKMYGDLVLGVVLHAAFLFSAAWMCHRRLADARPDPARLTEFYLWIAVGGVLGGVFNGLLAPVAFDRLIEYPLAIGLALALRPQAAATLRAPVQWATAAAGAAGLFVFVWLLGSWLLRDVLTPGENRAVRSLVPVAVAALLWGWGGSLRLAGAVASLCLSTLYVGFPGRVLLTERTYFGVHRVIAVNDGRWHQLHHGTTLHGLQSRDESIRRIPTAYYHFTGPLADVYAAVGARAPLRVGVVGLGAGSVAAYGRPGDDYTFFEIDPAVVRIASDPRYFTFLSDCRASSRVVLGDGRRAMSAVPDNSFDLIILDAFTSDAIPVHLLTHEAFESVYVPRLRPGGVITVNTSNRHVNLGYVLARVAESVGLVAYGRSDSVANSEEAGQGKKESAWMAFARDPADLGDIPRDSRWVRVIPPGSTPLWTDDHSDILRVLSWTSESPSR